MAKHKRDRALFELLAQERDRQKAKPDARAPEPREPREVGAEASPARPPGRPQPRPAPGDQPRRAAPTFVTRKAVIAIGGLRLSAYHLAIVGVVVACLCYLFYLLGAEYGQPGDGLPDVPAHPTMQEIQNQRPDGGLVKPGPTQPPLGHRVEPAGTDRPAVPGPDRPARRLASGRHRRPASVPGPERHRDRPRNPRRLPRALQPHAVHRQDGGG